MTDLTFILTRWIFPSSLSLFGVRGHTVVCVPLLLRSWHDLSYERPGGFIAETSDDVVLGLFLGFTSQAQEKVFCRTETELPVVHKPSPQLPLHSTRVHSVA